MRRLALALAASLLLVAAPVAAQTTVPPAGVVGIGFAVSDGVTVLNAGALIVPPEIIENLCSPLGADR